MLSPSTCCFAIICLYLCLFSTQATVFRCNRGSACGCSRYDANINARIVGGETAAGHSWGWMVSLRRSPTSNMCGGSIISPNFILTAAHCVDDIFVPSSLSVFVGVDRIYSSEGQQIQVSQIRMHPSYNPTTNENDIAILRLSRPINFNDPNVAKICLPDLDSSERYRYPSVGSSLVATGWGTLSSGGGVPDALRQVTVKAVGSNDRTCKPTIRNSNLQFCAAVSGGGKDTCQGDSGGPLMYYSSKQRVWVLAGITSYGRGCASAQYAGVYTRASVFNSWVKSIVGNDGVVTVPQNGANGHNMSILMAFLLSLFYVVRLMCD